jgi:hypothetical protein
MAKLPENSWLLRIDRRIVYLFVMLALAVPLFVQRYTSKLTMKPAPLPSARKIFDKIEAIAVERDEFERNPDGTPKLDDGGKPRRYGKIVLVVPDFGPQTRAELEPMLECTVRHLMMRRLKFAIVTTVIDGAGYCKEIPERLAREYGLEYGKDWADFGWKPGYTFLVKQMASSMPAALKTDRTGVDLSDEKAVAEKLPCFAGVKDASDVNLLVELTGLVGFVERWIGFFGNEKARPEIAHGCTSVSIPDAFTSMEAGKLIGLFEGIAGAAAYNEFLREIRRTGEPHPSSAASKAMTSQTVAHLMVIAFVVLGNAGLLISLLRSRKGRRA